MLADLDRNAVPTDHKTVSRSSPDVSNQAACVSQHAEARIDCHAGFESVGGKSMAIPLAARKQALTIEGRNSLSSFCVRHTRLHIDFDYAHLLPQP